MHASHATFHHLLQHMAETRPDEPAFPLNTRLSAEELGRSLALAEPKALIVDAANLEKLKGIALDSIQVRATLGDASAPGFLPLGGFFAAPVGGQAAASSADPFVILTTAAVEGTPRGAGLSHENPLHGS